MSTSSNFGPFSTSPSFFRIASLCDLNITSNSSSSFASSLLFCLFLFLAYCVIFFSSWFTNFGFDLAWSLESYFCSRFLSILSTFCLAEMILGFTSTSPFFAFYSACSTFFLFPALIFYVGIGLTPADVAKVSIEVFLPVTSFFSPFSASLLSSLILDLILYFLPRLTVTSSILERVGRSLQSFTDGLTAGFWFDTAVPSSTVAWF